MPINIYTVANHLESEGWKLISDSYKNLNTELEMECPEGHKQSQTYGQWRKHPVCEKCMAGDPYKVKKNKVPIKSIDTRRILALDAATGITGYSIYDNETLVSYGTFKVNKDLPTEQRIKEVKNLFFIFLISCLSFLFWVCNVCYLITIFAPFNIRNSSSLCIFKFCFCANIA